MSFPPSSPGSGSGLTLGSTDGPPAPGGSAPNSTAQVLSWLRTRTPEQLIALLRARPDLTVPAPTDLAVLARRMVIPTSIYRALEQVTAAERSTLTAVAVADERHTGVTLADLARWAPDAPPEELAAAARRLESLGLLLTIDETLHLPDAVTVALGDFPAGLAPPAGLTDNEVSAALAAVNEQQTEVLTLLDRTGPLGYSPPSSPSSRVVDELVAARLLQRVDPATVRLPREVSIALRDGLPLRAWPRPPDLPTATAADAARVDSTAAGQALATLGLVKELIDVIGGRPIPDLKSGGIGVRELRRLAKELNTEEHRLAFGLELLNAGRLITQETDHPERAGSLTWQVTALADDFLDLPDERAWAELALGWFGLTRDPARAGRPDPNSSSGSKALPALGSELTWIRGPADRRFLLEALASLPPGAGPGRAVLGDYLGYLAPQRSVGRRAALVDDTLPEATWLGLVAFDAIADTGRVLLTDPEPDQLAAALAAALPAPVNEVMVQADLTVVAPGRLAPALATRLAQVADLESPGMASVYRVTPSSIQRALDSGHSATDLHRLFSEHSRTPVPQALSYLIDDTARRHGVLRVGSAGCYLRSDDPALLAQAVSAASAAGFSLRLLAPTVAVGPADAVDVLNALAGNGVGVSAEDARGVVTDLRRRRPRAQPALQHRRREPAAPSTEQLTRLVDRLLATSDRDDHADLPQTVTATVAALREAVAGSYPVWITYAERDGSTVTRQVQPVVLSGGNLVAFDQLRGSMRSFALHRISRVSVSP